MQREENEKIGEEKGKSDRVLSELVFGQNGIGR
jgi:hypothetical protein